MGFNSVFKGLMKLEFSRQSFEKKKDTQTSNFMTIRTVGGGPELFRGADRQTDMTKLTFAIRNYANAPKNESCGNTMTGCGPRPRGSGHWPLATVAIFRFGHNLGNEKFLTFLGSPLLYCVGAKAEKNIKGKGKVIPLQAWCGPEGG